MPKKHSNLTKKHIHSETPGKDQSIKAAFYTANHRSLVHRHEKCINKNLKDK